VRGPWRPSSPRRHWRALADTSEKTEIEEAGCQSEEPSTHLQIACVGRQELAAAQDRRDGLEACKTQLKT
jgi:hypothetical protein